MKKWTTPWVSPIRGRPGEAGIGAPTAKGDETDDPQDRRTREYGPLEDPEQQAVSAW